MTSPAIAPTMSPPDPAPLLTALARIGARSIRCASRLAYWLPRGEHRLCCSNAHTFSPTAQARYGAVDIRCEWERGQVTHCGIILVVMVIPRRRIKLVAEVSRVDLSFIEQERYDPVEQMTYLLTEPLP